MSLLALHYTQSCSGITLHYVLRSGRSAPDGNAAGSPRFRPSCTCHGTTLKYCFTQAKAYLTAALRASAPLRIGGGPSRPLNHGYQTADWAAAGSSGQRQQEGRRLAPSRLQLYAVTDAACDARQVRRSEWQANLGTLPAAAVLRFSLHRTESGQCSTCAACAVPVRKVDWHTALNLQRSSCSPSTALHARQQAKRLYCQCRLSCTNLTTPALVLRGSSETGSSTAGPQHARGGAGCAGGWRRGGAAAAEGRRRGRLPAPGAGLALCSIPRP